MQLQLIVDGYNSKPVRQWRRGNIIPYLPYYRSLQTGKGILVVDDSTAAKEP
jgi:hypothetical protein